MRKVAYLVRNLFGDLVPDPMKGRAFGGIGVLGLSAVTPSEGDLSLVGLWSAIGQNFVLPSEIERGTKKNFTKDKAARFSSGVESLQGAIEAAWKKWEISLIIPGPDGYLSSEQLALDYESYFSQTGRNLRTWIRGSDVSAKCGEKSFYSESVLKHVGGAASFGYYVVTVVPFSMERAGEYANLAETLWLLIAFRAARGGSLLKEGESVMTSSCCERVPDRVIVDVTPEGIEPSYLTRDGHVPSVGFVVSHVSMCK